MTAKAASFFTPRGSFPCVAAISDLPLKHLTKLGGIGLAGPFHLRLCRRSSSMQPASAAVGSLPADKNPGHPQPRHFVRHAYARALASHPSAIRNLTRSIVGRLAVRQYR